MWHPPTLPVEILEKQAGADAGERGKLGCIGAHLLLCVPPHEHLSGSPSSTPTSSPSAKPPSDPRVGGFKSPLCARKSKTGSEEQDIQWDISPRSITPEWDISQTMGNVPPSHPPSLSMDICVPSTRSRQPGAPRAPPTSPNIRSHSGHSQNKLELSRSGRTDVGLLFPMSCIQSDAHISPLSLALKRVLFISRPIETSYIPREEYVPGRSYSHRAVSEIIEEGHRSMDSSGHTGMSMSSDNTSMSNGMTHECYWGCSDDEELDSEDESFDTIDGGDVMSKYLNMLSGFSELFTEDHRILTT